ncbi:MAG: helix-turn-helix domain-containing protein [Gammaproteobacteria bacterium]|nr:helix-turn-helix domain-containing protein [Gammaproteobacteria bacterium]
MSRRTDEQDGAGRLGRPAGLPKRWSAQRKVEVVLRLLRGEDIGEVSREIRVAPPELERWRREFLEGGQQGLKKKNRPRRRADADPGEAGGDDDAGRVAGGASRKKGVRGRAEEALEALGRVSPATNRPYPLTMVCETWRVARSSVYAFAGATSGVRSPGARKARAEDGTE